MRCKMVLYLHGEAHECIREDEHEAHHWHLTTGGLSWKVMEDDPEDLVILTERNIQN